MLFSVTLRLSYYFPQCHDVSFDIGGETHNNVGTGETVETGLRGDKEDTGDKGDTGESGDTGRK